MLCYLIYLYFTILLLYITFYNNKKLIYPSTIRRWIGQSKFFPGFSSIFLSNVKTKFEQKSSRVKVCSVTFDELFIKEFLEFSKDYDFIDGIQD